MIIDWLERMFGPVLIALAVAMFGATVWGYIFFEHLDAPDSIPCAATFERPDSDLVWCVPK